MSDDCGRTPPQGGDRSVAPAQSPVQRILRDTLVRLVTWTSDMEARFRAIRNTLQRRLELAVNSSTMRRTQPQEAVVCLEPKEVTPLDRITGVKVTVPFANMITNKQHSNVSLNDAALAQSLLQWDRFSPPSGVQHEAVIVNRLMLPECPTSLLVTPFGCDISDEGGRSRSRLMRQPVPDSQTVQHILAKHHTLRDTIFGKQGRSMDHSKFR